ncbi:hypothetical protein [Campylobacter troglodytis]|uniref:hypothetical protein n=1 Tax=Campylobacter troglodytis TaxID=654363 RepID=UPI00115BA58E|nr:hypothetical protein [Campylobacter troglodytis]TQR60233.1 hypothetical protein DMC01_06610 [Campylobacter troglodytis]
MNISSLNELLQTQIINEGSPSSVLGFARKLSQLKQGYAFFSNDEEELKEATKCGAFVLVSEKDCEIVDKEVFYLQTNSLKRSIFKLLRFLSEEKNLEFLLCKGLEMDLCEAFGVAKLGGDIYEDFDLLINAKNSSLFAFDNSKYLLEFCASYEAIEGENLAKSPQGSLFYSQIKLKNDKILKLKLCFAYSDLFTNFANFILLKGKKFILNEKKLDFYQVFFVNEENFITDFGKSSRAFIVVQDGRHFAFLSEVLSNIQGFKIANRESLFCDFAYKDLSELRGFTDFRYCLVKANYSDFTELFTKNTKETSLFDLLD